MKDFLTIQFKLARGKKMFAASIILIKEALGLQQTTTSSIEGK